MRSASWVLVLAAACGDNHAIVDGAIDTAVDAHTVDAGDPNNPLTLFDTGLCVDRACTQISPGVHAYTPQFPLWADTASKRRWYKLPAGTQIDTTDMDHWVFPVGTKFWKEFTRDDGAGHDIRIETRLVMRIGPGDLPADWFYVSYQWNDTQDDTHAVPMGVMNANGTQHDIPPRVQCKGCHENLKPSRILGFQAIQLDVPAVNAGDTTLASLVGDGTLTTNPTGGPTYFQLPGTASEQAGLGYIHANCGHCHNPSSAVFSIVTMQLRLTVGSLGSVATTPAYMTAIGKPAQVPVGTFPKDCVDSQSLPAECIISKNQPDHSAMMFRFEAAPNDSAHMPQLGSEMMDPTGDATLRTWITNIP